MKMIGVEDFSSLMRCWISRPLRSGRLTSRIKQLGTTVGNCVRNSCADSNSAGCHPSFWIKSSRDSRTEISSSTTTTVGLVGGTGSNLERRFVVSIKCMRRLPRQEGLLQIQRSFQRLEQRRLAKRLQKA